LRQNFKHTFQSVVKKAVFPCLLSKPYFFQLFTIYRICWAFAATGVLEYQIKTKRNITIQLSEQELLDCNTVEVDCSTGGWPAEAYKYIVKKGIGESTDYEYLSYSNECLNDRINRTVNITNDALECM
jgi:Papain family cysteine protease